MTKTEYLDRLRAALTLMPAEERERQLAYYEEMVDDMLEDGMSEDEAAAQLGEPEKVAEELLAEIPMATLVKNRVKTREQLSALTVVLLVLGFPLWFPLLISFAAILLSLLITLWAVGLSVGISVAAAGAGALALAVLTLIGKAALPFLAAVGAFVGGAGVLILGVLLTGVIIRGLARLCRLIWRGFKKMLVK